jgi:iron-sulfur cluster assembly protein
MMTLTQKAVSEIKRIQSSTADTGSSMLRVMVTGGGCSGLSYKLGFDTQPPTENDKILELEGVKVVVDTKSSLFLSGTELDFTDGLNGKGFIFSNPNAKKTCGCGNSFST